MNNSKKSRKLHALQGTILYSFPRQVSTKGPYHHQPYYLLKVQLHQVFTPSQEDIYAFPQQVPNWNQFTSLLKNPNNSPFTARKELGVEDCEIEKNPKKDKLPIIYSSIRFLA